jgi:hypothetical protein
VATYVVFACFASIIVLVLPCVLIIRYTCFDDDCRYVRGRRQDIENPRGNDDTDSDIVVFSREAMHERSDMNIDGTVTLPKTPAAGSSEQHINIPQSSQPPTTPPRTSASSHVPPTDSAKINKAHTPSSTPPQPAIINTTATETSGLAFGQATCITSSTPVHTIPKRLFSDDPGRLSPIPKNASTLLNGNESQEPTTFMTEEERVINYFESQFHSTHNAERIPMARLSHVNLDDSETTSDSDCETLFDQMAVRRSKTPE